MKIHIYIDGLNLYYGALKNTKFKWLNPAMVCRFLLPAFDVVRIEYFTALVEPWPHNPNRRIKQQVYLRSLRTLADLDIVLGRFLTTEVHMPSCTPNRTDAICKSLED